MPQLHTYIREAINEVENRSRPSIPFFENHDSFDVLVDLIVDETESTHRELRVSEDTYKSKIEEIIEDIADSDDPVGNFHSQLVNVEKGLRDDLQEYRVLFPLNFAHSSAPGFDSRITIRDVEFHRTSHRSWEKFQAKASEESHLDEFLEALPTEEPRTNPLARQYYWEVTYEAGEVDYAINRIESALKILLGKIAFASQAFLNKHSMRNTFWRYGTISLNEPLCFLVIQDDEFLTFYTSTDYTPRRRYSLSGNSQDRFEEVYPKLPDFEGELSELEEHLASALKSYFEAISEPDDDARLRHYWQCLEAVTLTRDENYGAADPLKRARATARPQLDFEINEDRIELLTDKRNSIIHEGGEQNVSEGDNQYLKTLADYSIYFVTTNLDNYSIEEFEEFYYFGSKSEDSILQSKANREKEIQEKEERIDELETEIGSIDQVIEWLNLDE
jgi:archaellum component FlaC